MNLRVWVGLVLVALVSLAGPARARADDAPADERAKAARILGDPGYQRVLPDRPEGGASGTRANERGHVQPPPRRSVDEPEARTGGSSVATAATWVIVGVLLLLLVAFVVRELGGFEKAAALAPGAGEPDAGVDAAATAAVVERPLDDAEALARAGRFGEAIHALLLRTLEELMRRLDRPMPRSRTSREILAEARLPDEARGALGHLVSAVEVSFFGGAEPGAEDYQVCVERFRRFADAYTRGVRA